jgi:hypothetical protein
MHELTWGALVSRWVGNSAWSVALALGAFMLGQGVGALRAPRGFASRRAGDGYARCELRIAWSQVPLLSGVRELAAQGFVTGASGRNWAGYGGDVRLPDGFAPEHRALLTDPQTSGGLLVSCTPAAVDEVLAVFRRHGFDGAAVIGEVAAADAPRLTVR